MVYRHVRLNQMRDHWTTSIEYRPLATDLEPTVRGFTPRADLDSSTILDDWIADSVPWIVTPTSDPAEWRRGERTECSAWRRFEPIVSAGANTDEEQAVYFYQRIWNGHCHSLLYCRLFELGVQ